MASIDDPLDLVRRVRSRDEWLSGDLRQILNMLPIMVFVAEDQTCQSMYANVAGERLLHAPAGANVSKSAPDVTIPRQFEVFAGDGTPIAADDLPVQRAARGEEVVGCEVELRFKDGEQAWLYGNATPLRDERGRIWGAVGAFQDITERKRAEDTLAAELRAMKRLQQLATQVVETDELEAPLTAVLEAAIDFLGADFGNIQLYDETTQALRIVVHHGFKRRFLDFFDTVDAHRGSACGIALHENRQVVIEDVEKEPAFAPSLEEARAAGFRAVQTKPLVSTTGKVVGMLSTHFRQTRGFSEHDLRLMDICARQAADAIHSYLLQQAVRDSEMRLRKVAEQRQLALDAAKLGWWQCDPVSGTVQWDESFRTIFGLTTYIGSVDALLNDVHHPEDVPFLRAKIEAALDPIAPRPFSAEYRICRPEGQIRWIEAHGLAAFEGEGQLRRAVNFVGTVADISARRFAEEELRSAKAEAERSMLARSKFLAAASHDLRQPVQSLTLLLAALKPHATAQPVAKAVGLMENALDGLNGLLSSILDVSRLDAGVVMPQMSAVDIGAILSRLAKEYAMLAAGKGLRLRCVGRHAVVRTDPNLIERVLRNLIENAIRYTDVGGIVLGARIRSGLVHVEVVDSGIGMPADKVPDIFEEFFQVGNPARDRNKGLGLGLAIVHRIVGLLGAEIKVFSNEGRGSRFCVLLPLIAEAPIQPSHSEDMPAEGGSARVLVIEDDVTVRTGLELLLRGWGYVVVAVNSGEAALDACARANWQLDAVIADHRLGPGLSGTDTAKVIRSKAGWTIPILVVTGDTAPERIAEVHGSGFTLMHKPVTADALRTTLERLLH